MLGCVVGVPLAACASLAALARPRLDVIPATALGGAALAAVFAQAVAGHACGACEKALAIVEVLVAGALGAGGHWVSWVRLEAADGTAGVALAVLAETRVACGGHLSLAAGERLLAIAAEPRQFPFVHVRIPIRALLMTCPLVKVLLPVTR